MADRSADEFRTAVRDAYGLIAGAGDEDCGCGPGCCAGSSASEVRTGELGYSEADIAAAPPGANLGLGCGNPAAIASLREGETVVDLGSGGGFDCFLAARQVGERGHVIGVDMTPEMIARARENVRAAGVSNVSFRLGEIEHLPVVDGTADVVMSNCVINLSPEKRRVLDEAFRVLKPGGRLAVADVIARSTLPERVREDLEAYVRCVAGAVTARELELLLTEAGFTDVRIRPMHAAGLKGDPVAGIEVRDYVVPAYIEARRPERGS